MSRDLLFEAIKWSLADNDRGGNPFNLGFDAGKNGASASNCSFSIFSSKEHTQAWERGKAAGEKARKENSSL